MQIGFFRKISEFSLFSYIKPLLFAAAALSAVTAFAAEKKKALEENSAEKIEAEEENSLEEPPAPKNLNPSELEKIKVTGSRISRIDTEGPSPLIVYSKEDLENSGYSSAGDFLRDTTALHFGVQREKAGESDSGESSAKIKGEASLILINGLRVAEDPGSAAVDLNLIPIYAIERVEILKDGGSALYGSDAVGGVINFITKKDFSGVEFHAQAAPALYPWYKGGSRADAAVIFGKTKSRWSYIGSFHLRLHDSIEDYERTSTDKNLSPTLPCASSDAACIAHLEKYSREREIFPPLIERTGISNSARINLASFATRYPHYRQLYSFLQGEYKLKGDAALYGQLIAGYKNNIWDYPPIPGYVQTPGGGIGYRFLESGLRTVNYHNFIGDLTLGAKGWLSPSWDYDFNVKLSRTVKYERAEGLVLVDKITEAIAQGKYDPFFQDEEQTFLILDQLRERSYKPRAGKSRDLMSALYTGNSYQESALFAAGLDLSGESGFWDIELASGLQFYSKTYKSIADKQTKAKNILSDAASDGQGKRSVLSYYLEGVKYFSDALELQLAGRADYYSDDFGLTLNPKAAFRWQPSPNILFRGSAGSAFIAPTLQDLNRSITESYPTLFDSTACYNELKETGAFQPIFDKLGPLPNDKREMLAKQFVIDQRKSISDPNLSDEVKQEMRTLSESFSEREYCIEKQVSASYRGNKNLEETRAWAASFGSHFQINENNSLTIDMWYITKSGEVSNGLGKPEAADPKKTIDAELLYGRNYVSDYENYEIVKNKDEAPRAVLKKERAAGGKGIIINRDAGKAYKPLMTGETPRAIETKMLNLAGTQKAGLDIDWDSDMSRINIYGGSPYFKNRFSYILLSKREDFPGVGFANVIGQWGQPPWRNISILGWKNKKHNISLAAYSTAAFAKKTSRLENIPIYTRLDLDYQWMLNEKTTLKFGFSNLLFALDLIENSLRASKAKKSTEGEKSKEKTSSLLKFGAPPIDEEANNDKLASSLFESRGPFFFIGIKHKL